MLSLAATGVTADFDARLFDTATTGLLEREAWGDPKPSTEGRWPAWGADYAGVTRLVRPDDPFVGDLHTGVAVTRGGGITFYRGTVPRIERDAGRQDSLDAVDLREWARESISAARAILSDLGAHGRLRLGYRVDAAGRLLMFMNQHVELVQSIIIKRWTSFDSEDEAERVFDEVERTLGFGPGDIHWR